MKYTISIPEPCHENWGHMTNTAKGKFCGSCKKEVVDFSNTSIAMLSQKLDSGSKLCGRFRPDQLNRAIRSSNGNAIRQHGVMVAAVALLAGVSPVLGQSPEPVVVAVAPAPTVLGRIAVNPSGPVIPQAVENSTITGTISDYESPLPGAKVVLKGSTIAAQTDFDGNFSLKIPHDSLKLNAVLEVFHIGYQSKTIKINKATGNIDVFLKMEEDIMGEMVIVRKPNLFDRVGNLFKRKEKKSCDGVSVGEQ